MAVEFGPHLSHVKTVFAAVSASNKTLLGGVWELFVMQPQSWNVVNLIYDLVIFSGSEAECWEYIENRFGSSSVKLLVDVRPAD